LGISPAKSSWRGREVLAYPPIKSGWDRTFLLFFFDQFSFGQGFLLPGGLGLFFNVTNLPNTIAFLGRQLEGFLA